jgi:hypothetical protein
MNIYTDIDLIIDNLEDAKFSMTNLRELIAEYIDHIKVEYHALGWEHCEADRLNNESILQEE